MALVLGAAMLMKDDRESLPGSVKFIFQPAEEKPPGGATRMIQEGVPEDPAVDVVFGMHNSTDIPKGEIIVADGPVMAGSDDFIINIK